MNYNVEKAFGFIKNDPQWVKKLLIPSIISLVSFVLMLVGAVCLGFSKTSGIGMFVLMLLSLLVYLILGFVVYGYSLQYGHDRIHNENAPLPEWKNLWSFLFIGFKASLGSILYFLPVLILGAAAGFLQIYAKSSPDSYSLASYVVNMIYNLLYLVYLLFFFVFNASFIKDFNVFAFLNFAKAYRMLKGNWKNYFIAVLLILAAGVVFNLAALVLILTIIGLLALPFAVIYIQIVTMDLIAQFVVLEEDSKKISMD